MPHWSSEGKAKGGNSSPRDSGLLTPVQCRTRLDLLEAGSSEFRAANLYWIGGNCTETVTVSLVRAIDRGLPRPCSCVRAVIKRAKCMRLSNSAGCISPRRDHSDLRSQLHIDMTGCLQSQTAECSTAELRQTLVNSYSKGIVIAPATPWLHCSCHYP